MNLKDLYKDKKHNMGITPNCPFIVVQIFVPQQLKRMEEDNHKRNQ